MATSLLAMVISTCYLGLTGFAVVQARQTQGIHQWFVPVTVLALAASLMPLVDASWAEPLTILLSAGMLVAFGALTFVFLNQGGMVRWWLAGSLSWLTVLALAAFFVDPTILGQQGWLGQVFDPVNLAGLIAIAGLTLIGATLLASTFYAFYAAHLSELANRALFWVILVPLVLVGVALSNSGSPLLVEIGWVIGALSVFGVAYGITAHHIFDVRRALREVLGVLLSTLAAALAIMVALLLSAALMPGNQWNILLMAAVALVVAALYVPLYHLAQIMARRLFSDSERQAQALRQYSQRIGTVIELEEVSRLVTQTLVSVLRIRQGGLLLTVRDDEDRLWLESVPVPQDSHALPAVHGEIDPASPVFEALFVKQKPLLQFDVEFGRDFASTDTVDVDFFKQLRMSAYAPVIVDGQPLGMLASGPKLTDQPYDPTDLELLATIANQTGVALRNARLVVDLRRLNLELEAANQHLARLDGVKSDFITIASHELRTPLAQVLGYTDIIDSLTDLPSIPSSQLVDLTQNLRKAAERMESLISAMLDMSKIDVNAMDLQFAQTSLEAVLRLAIEPLTEAVRTRKLTLSARGLRGLPPLEADMKRLVQAFRNVISNAVKYTPDGGLINIRAWLEKREDDPDEIFVEIADTGVGIDPVNQQLVFEKFFRVADPGLHSTGSTKFMGAGPGLGLTIARGVIEGHGGRIWLESPGFDVEACPGTIVYIALPILPPADAKRVLPFEETTGALPQLTPESTAETRQHSRSAVLGFGKDV